MFEIFKAIFKPAKAYIAEWDAEWNAEQEESRAFFSGLNDVDFVKELGALAEDYELAKITRRNFEKFLIEQKFDIGIDILKNRIEINGLDNHPDFSAIVHELAALPASDASDIEHKMTAILNATGENPWRALAAGTKAAPALEPAP